MSTVKVSPYFNYKLGGKEYSLQYKKPNIGDQIKIGQLTASMKGGFPTLDNFTENLVYKIASLNTTIVAKPADLDFMAIDTEEWEVVLKMYEDYEKFAFFRGEVQVKHEQT